MRLSLLRLLFSATALLFLFSLFGITSSGQPVANSDFYIVDRSQYLEVSHNDANPSGQMLVTQPDHAGVYICNFCGPGSLPHTPFITPGNYLGFDFFTYKYVVCCGNPPGPDSNIATVDVLLIGNDDAQNAGDSCKVPAPASVGKPVNVTNGNMWLQQTDYSLPGLGETIEINRFYNSIIQTSGLFGLGWSTKYDESLQIYPDDKMIRLNEPDGRASYFGRANIANAFTSFSANVVGQIIKNTDGTYTLTYKDGREHKFNSGGRLLWQKDRNGNQTTLNYDTNGILTGITDAVGRTLTISTGSNGNVSQISDALSLVATYEYYPSTSPSQLKTVTYNDGSKYNFEYTTINGKTYLTTVKDALANILETHQYDSSGRATTSEKHGGVEKYTLDYSNPAFTTVTDARDNVTTYHFIRKYGTNLITKTDGACSCGGGSQVTEFTYNDVLNLVQKKDALGRDTFYNYDSARNLTSVQDVLGTQSFTYNSLGQVLTATDRMGGVTTNTYSSVGNLLTSKDALNNTTTFTYTSAGQPETIKDALNHTTTLTWDLQGRLTKITDAHSKETNIGYDARARVTSITNAKNEVTLVTYDLNNRVNKVTYPDTNFTTFTYDLAGRRTAVTDPLSHTTNFGYDSAYRLTSVTDALNHATTFGYDLMSNLTSQTDALGNVTNLEYDDFDRLEKIIYPAPSPTPSPSPSPTASPTPDPTRLVESMTYDKLGNIKTHVDTAGRTTTYDYDTANRLIKITDPLNQLTQFEYNARSQMTKVIDALSQQYVFTYDALGRQLSQTRAGSTMSYVVDAVGNRTKRTDYLGRITKYSYDNLNRLTKIEYGDPAGQGTEKQYGYDDLSRLVSAINEAGTVAFTYDNRNRLKTETDVFGHVVEYGYDPANRRTSLKLDGTNYSTYAYDVADRLSGITNVADSTTVSYGYDIANRLTSRTYPNGVNSTYEYDGMSRLTRLTDINSTTTLFDRQYTYNSANQISQIVEPSLTRILAYDNTNRLTNVTNGGTGESYAFDAVGNRTSSHRSSSYGYSV